MAESRFDSSDEIVVEQLKLNAKTKKNKNTTNSAQMQLNVWEKWANVRKFNPKLEKYEQEGQYSAANDPQTGNDPQIGPQMIPDVSRK